MEGARGPCGPEKEWTGLSWKEVWREPEDRVGLGERMDRAELERGVEGARGPCGPKKEWTGLSWNEVWREPEDRVARRKNGQG